MKSILTTLTITILMCFACSSTRKATACFEVQTTSPAAGAVVTFTNCSDFGRGHAFWDFGDGTPEVNDPFQTVEHVYAASGTYRVVLRVERGRSTDQVSKDIVVQ
jgi:PKD repeat protein